MSFSHELQQLGEMHQRGTLSEAEFSRAKARVIDGDPSRRPASTMGSINTLRRSRSDRWLGGVCGGLAEFTGLPGWSWRLIFALSILCAGTGIAIYLLCWFFVPIAPAAGGDLRAEPA